MISTAERDAVSIVEQLLRAGESLVAAIEKFPYVIVDERKYGLHVVAPTALHKTPTVVPATEILEKAASFDKLLCLADQLDERAGIPSIMQRDQLKHPFAMIMNRMSFSLNADASKPSFRLLRIEKDLIEKFKCEIQRLIPYEIWATALEKDRKGGPARLVRYMSNRESAPFDDVMRDVHHARVTPEAVRKNTHAANRALVILGSPLHLFVRADWVLKEFRFEVTHT